MIFNLDQIRYKINDLLNEVFQIAEEYDSTQSYVIDDYCTYDGKILVCTTPTSGAFDSSAWDDSVIVMDVIKAIKSRLTAAESNISTAQSDISAAQSDISAAQDDISALNLSLTELNTVKSGTVTMLVAGSGGDNIKVRQVGHVVSIWGFSTGMSIAANTATTIARVSGVSLPPTPVRTRGAAGANAYTPQNDAYVGLEASGNLIVHTSAASSALYFNITYIA